MTNRSILRIRSIGTDPTVAFAGAELERILHRMTGGTVVHMPGTNPRPEADTLVVGCAEDFPDVALPEVADANLDDAIVLDIRERCGIIVGANPRATLIAAYRYLSELGCRWVRPGNDGELIPECSDPLFRDISVSEAPECRHRGLAIEGACSSEHVTALIDWLPKVGMNTYFIEYFCGYIFYNNWYSERHKASNRRALMPEEQAAELAERAIVEIKRRGLLFHRAGHGWTCMPLGIPPELWDETIERDFGEQTRHLALYQGKRAMYRGIPRRTNLCYSQPEVRTMIVDGIVEYAEAHPEVDYLHFWLADGSNHFCECEDCQEARPADFYVMMLNELDAALSAKGLATRIVFIIYVDLLWPPAEQRIRNSERFVMMFAPLHRPYFACFEPEERQEAVPPFVLNKLTFKEGQNLNHLAGWQQVFDGDSLVFDYRFMWGQYDDPGHAKMASVLDADTPLLREVGLNGMISDQSQRVFMPSGFPMTVLACRLWGADVSYETLADDHFAAAFGREGDLCRRYLEELSELFQARWLSEYTVGSEAPVPPEVVAGLQAVPARIARFLPVIERNRTLDNPVQARSWEILRHHAQLCSVLALAIACELKGDRDGAMAHWRKLENQLVEQEGEIHQAFDVFLFLLSMRRKYRIPQIVGME